MFDRRICGALLLLLLLLQLVRSNSKKSRCLLVSIDNRPLNKDVHSNHYPTVTALLNREYAIHHGYDFLQLVNQIDDLEKQVHAKYAKYDAIPPTDNAKDAATAFHVGLHQFRAASWAKLPPLWDVTRKMGAKYDLIFYIDSDAVISPFFRNQSIDELLDKWQAHNRLHPPIKGISDITQATFIFFNNFPWRDDMPCAGTFLFRPNARGEQILRQWWDFSGIPDRNFKHFHEQDALWHMVDGDPSGRLHYLMRSSFAILGERQFPSPWQRYEGLWLVHIASYNYQMRNPILNLFLRALDLHEARAYEQRVGQIEIYRVPTLVVCEQMEAVSAADPTRIPLASFPTYPITNETAWWSLHVSSEKVEKMPLSELLEGRLVTRRNEFWIVLNGTRRAFPSFDTFLGMGFESDMGFPLTLAEIRSLPEGDKLPVIAASASASASGAGGGGGGGGKSSHALQKMLGRGSKKRRGRQGVGLPGFQPQGQADHDVDMR